MQVKIRSPNAISYLMENACFSHPDTVVFKTNLKKNLCPGFINSLVCGKTTYKNSEVQWVAVWCVHIHFSTQNALPSLAYFIVVLMSDLCEQTTWVQGVFL